MAAEHVADLRAQCAPDAFAGFDPERFPSTTLPALALAAAAYRYTGPVGERVSLALRDALWEQGRDISDTRSEEHTSELQSLMRISYAVFCLKKKKSTTRHTT